MVTGCGPGAAHRAAAIILDDLRTLSQSKPEQ